MAGPQIFIATPVYKGWDWVAETLASELDISVAVLDPLEGLAKGADGDYLSIMGENLAALRTANGCR